MTLDDLLPDARLHLPGAPDILIKDHLRQSLIRFCRDTHAWREELTPVYPVKGVSRYYLDLPAGSEVVAVRSATQGGQPVRVDLNVFGLMTLPKLNSQAPVTVVAVLQPTATTNDIPERLVSHHRQGLVSGAIETLVTMPKQEWSNPPSAEYHAQQYAYHVGQAKIRAAAGESDQPLTVTMHPFI